MTEIDEYVRSLSPTEYQQEILGEFMEEANVLVIRLENTSGDHNKFYNIYVRAMPSVLYRVIAEWGVIGGRSRGSQVKWEGPSFTTASRQANSLAQTKIRTRGYHMVTSVSFEAPIRNEFETLTFEEAIDAGYMVYDGWFMQAFPAGDPVRIERHAGQIRTSSQVQESILRECPAIDFEYLGVATERKLYLADVSGERFFVQRLMSFYTMEDGAHIRTATTAIRRSDKAQLLRRNPPIIWFRRAHATFTDPIIVVRYEP